MTKQARQFAPLEPCAINPQAFGGEFFEAPSTWTVDDGVATLTINGPLGHHSSFWEQSYEDLVAHATAIMAERPRLVVLSIDSPGGVVAGCFDTVRRLRAIFGTTPVVAYVTGSASSAAYALACVADEIVVGETSFVGSVGVIDAMVDVTAADAQAGVRFHIFTSGKRKADGVPHVAMTPEAAAARQALVDTIAGRFFDLVAERRGIDAGAVRELEANVFLGPEAVALGLADRVEHRVDFLARLGSTAPPAARARPTTLAAARAAIPPRLHGAPAPRTVASFSAPQPAARAATTQDLPMSAPARSTSTPSAARTPSRAELARLEAQIAKLEAKHSRGRAAPPRPIRSGAGPSNAPSNKRVELDRRMGVGMVRAVRQTATSLTFGTFHKSELGPHDIRLDDVKGMSAGAFAEHFERKLPPRPKGMAPLTRAERDHLDRNSDLKVYQANYVAHGMKLVLGALCRSTDLEAPGVEVLSKKRLR